MKKITLFLATIAVAALSLAGCGQKTESVPFDPATRGSNDIKLGAAGYSYLFYDIEQTLQFLKNMQKHCMN